MDAIDQGLVDVLHAARREAATQLAFMPIASQFRSEVRAAAAVLRDTTHSSLISALARHGATQGCETNMREFLMNLDATPVTTQVERSFGVKGLKDEHLQNLTTLVDDVRSKSAEYNTLRRAKSHEAIGLAQSESAYYLAATVLMSKLSDLSRKGYDTSSIDNQIAKERLLERFDSMRLPMWRSLSEPKRGPALGVGC